MKFRLLFPLLLVLFCSPLAQATTYYVASTGQDACNSGTSPDTAWQSINRVNQQHFTPGDTILFKGGETFGGSLIFTSSGTAAQPITVASYTTSLGGTATISSGVARGFFGSNVSGVTLTNLIFVGASSPIGTDGVSFFSDNATGNHDINISFLDVSGYGGRGIAVVGWAVGSTFVAEAGYHTVAITDSTAHANIGDGISVTGKFPYLNTLITIDRVTSHDNTGRAGSNDTSGNGIVLSGTDTGNIRNSFAFANGLLNNFTTGPSGILVFDAKNITVASNLSHDNLGVTAGGDGIVLGQGLQNSSFHDNLTSTNHGDGYRAAHAPDDAQWHDNTLTNNTSSDDARVRGGSLELYGGIRNLTVSGNTFSLASGSSPVAAVSAQALSSSGRCMDVVSISNNALSTTGPDLINFASTPLACATNLHFLGNSFTGSPFAIVWNGITYATCAAWRIATGQENCALPPPPAPSITSITPAFGTQGQETPSIVVTGTGFQSGITCDFGAGITVISCVFGSTTQLTADLFVSSGAAVGARDVIVTNPDTQHGIASGGFTVAAAPAPPPTVSSLTPNNGAQGATLNVVIAGANFVTDATAAFGTGITVNSTTFNSDTQLTTNITIAGGASTGGYPLTVMNPDAQFVTIQNAFTVTSAPVAPPVVTSATPNSGAQGATLAVVIAGTGFLTSPTCSFGPSVTINACTRTTAIRIDANITIAGGAATGGRTVTVTNTDLQSGSLANGFTITGATPAAPTVTSTSPNSGAQGQTFSSILILGTGFQSGATSAFGSGITVNSTTFNSATQLTVNMTIDGAATVGSRTVTVTNPDTQFGTLASGFSVTAVVFPPPSISSVTPNSGLQGQTLNTTIAGANFQSLASCDFGSGITVNSCTFTGASSLTANLTIAATATAGARTLIVTNPDAQSASKSSAFIVVVPAPAPPTVTSVSPNNGAQGANLTGVVITGTGFQSGAAVDFGAGITVSAIVFTNTTHLSVSLSIAVDADISARDVTVTNPDAQVGTAIGAFNVTTIVFPAPTVTSVSPASGTQGATIASDVITGTGFRTGAGCSYGSGITVNSCTFNSATQMTANITIAAGAASGGRTVTVANMDAQSGSLVGGFTVTIPVPAPTVSSVNPTSGAQGQSFSITILGTGFQSGASSTFGAGITVNSTTFVSATQLTASITIAGGATIATRDVTVTNPDTQSGTLVAGFSVTAVVFPAPTVTSATPNTGGHGLTIAVAIGGTNFRSGATSAFGTGITVNSTTFNSATSLTANVTVQIGTAPGARNVTVTNTDLQSGVLTNGFTVTASPTAHVTWNDNSPSVTNATSESGFKILRSDGGAPPVQVGTVGQNITAFDDLSPPTTQQFCYQVVAADSPDSASSTSIGCAGPINPSPSPLAMGANTGTGTVVVDSGTGGTNGTWNGAWTTHASYGNALSFTAANNVLTISGMTALPVKHTIELWLQQTGAGGGARGRIFDKSATVNPSFEVLFLDNAASVLQFGAQFTGTNGVWQAPAPSINVWHHVAVAYDTSSLNPPAIWIDGVVQTITTIATPTGAAVANDVSRPLQFGNLGDGSRNWAGFLDEIRLYNRLLTTAEVVADMNAPLP